MSKSNIGKSAVVLAVAAMAVAYNASASIITIDLGTVLSGSFTTGDQSSSPYSVVTITDSTYNGNSGVYLTMANPGLGFAGSGAYEHVNQGGPMNPGPAFLFDLSAAGLATVGSITETAHSGIDGSTFTTYTPSVGGSYAGHNANFNLGFTFAEGSMSTDGNKGVAGGNDGPGRNGSYADTVEFGALDSVTYFIKGVSSSEFVSSGGNYSEAAIDDSGPNLWIGGANEITTPVPEPGTALAGVLMLWPFGVNAVRMLRKQPAA